MTHDGGDPRTPPTLDAAGIARAQAVADAIDRYVAADVDLATSVVGMGLDAMAGALRGRAAETYDEIGPWVALAADVLAYVGTGTMGTVLASRLGDLLTMPEDGA